jgi:putative intracellular protease/amidase
LSWTRRHHRPVGPRRLEALGGRRQARPAPTVGVLVYRGVSTAEIDIPVTVLADRLGAHVMFVGVEPGILPGVEPSRDVIVDVVASEAPLPEWLVVPGGLGWRTVIDDPAVMAWLAAAGAKARGILAISTGSLLLASVGQLTGVDATGHWLGMHDLERMGANVRRERVTDAGRIVTASGALPAAQVAGAFADRVSWSCPA